MTREITSASPTMRELAQHVLKTALIQSMPQADGAGDSALTEAGVRARIAGLPEPVQQRVVCALVGHSRIVTYYMGYISCARCTAQIGDAMGGVDTLVGRVLAGHNCEACAQTIAQLTWHDTLLAPDPTQEAK